jgi:hypothetical protein
MGGWGGGGGEQRQREGEMKRDRERQRETERERERERETERDRGREGGKEGGREGDRERDQPGSMRQTITGGIMRHTVVPHDTLVTVPPARGRHDQGVDTVPAELAHWQIQVNALYWVLTIFLHGSRFAECVDYVADSPRV